jgi:hypothetical protein
MAAVVQAPLWAVQKCVIAPEAKICAWVESRPSPDCAPCRIVLAVSFVGAASKSVQTFLAAVATSSSLLLASGGTAFLKTPAHAASGTIPLLPGSGVVLDEAAGPLGLVVVVPAGVSGVSEPHAVRVSARAPAASRVRGFRMRSIRRT